ncbi:MAG: dTDP-4-dehydrorhamnose 3,5-epimerase / dTDP-4-dehydrorhamnose reductase [Acidimicrobiaceae bacterium]|nr:dTDP-4-dehydrorhamnose 3,5-epimerase / dTDP-4-dehydrorhamnose reductase [Acidimicrobiaceae bacterium]
MPYSNFDKKLFENDTLDVSTTKIPGMLVIRLVVMQDPRGWMKESFQVSKLVPLGFPEDFDPVGNMVSSIQHRGFTRGIHADTVNKYISLTRGEAFAAIVDLRVGETFGTVEMIQLDPGNAIYVPKGCGNSYQTLTDDVDYTYLEDARVSSDPSTCVGLGDPQLAIVWPIPLVEARLLPDDVERPGLREIVPVGS